MRILASPEFGFVVWLRGRRKHNRNFQNVSAYARGQIGIGIEGRFVINGCREGDILDSVASAIEAAATAATCPTSRIASQALKIQYVWRKEIDLLVSGTER